MSGCESAPVRSKKTARALEQERPDLLARRRDWFGGQFNLDPARLVFIDETSPNTKMSWLHGRAPFGDRCDSRIPHGQWKTTTFTEGLRLSGMTAPIVLEGAMNGAAFQAHLQQVPIATLAPGDIVIVVNLPAHKAQAVRHAVEGAGLPVTLPSALQSRPDLIPSRRLSQNSR